MSKRSKRHGQATRNSLSSQTAGKGVSKPGDRSKPGGPTDRVAVEQPDRTVLAVGGVLALVFLWSYWPTLMALVERWNAVADYSHGFLVPPLAVGFLWFRRDRLPRPTRGAGLSALLVLGLALAFRIAGARMFLPAFDAWSIPIWLAGVCLLLIGWRGLWWALPSLIFLLFMVPLPFRAEHALSVPLRHLATTLSCVFLQCIGQPALQEGTTIIMGEQSLNVVRECSGLRMLMGIAALATAYIILTRKPWWQKVLLLMSIVPVATIANTLRIALTAMLLQYASTEASQSFSHDAAGWFTNALAAGLFAGVLWCIGKLFVEAGETDKRVLIAGANETGGG